MVADKKRPYIRRDGMLLLFSSFFVAVLIGAYAAIFIQYSNYMHAGGPDSLFQVSIDRSFILHMCVVSVLVSICTWALGFSRRFSSILFRYRFLIAVALFAVCMVLKISGSSLAAWSSFLGTEPFNGVLFGNPRSIRTDEWLVFTPFAFSQSVTGCSALSPVICGGGMDVTTVYAQPAWALATFFRPFLWGYMFLGPERGLSFFWCGRLIVLFIITFEFGRWLTYDRRKLALCFALLVTFTPLVQWWFATNGTAELLIFGQGFVLALECFFSNRSRGLSETFFLVLALVYCALAFALVLYPAWQIPFAYVFAGLSVMVFVRHRDVLAEMNSKVTHIAAPAALGVLCIVCLLGFVLWQSYDVIMALANTRYPGLRPQFGEGVDYLLELARPVASLTLPFMREDAFSPNSVEFAGVVSFFPLGVFALLFCIARFKQRGALCLLVPFLLLFSYFILNCPASIGKLFLLDRSYGQRILFPLGYLNIAMLVYSICLLSNSMAFDSGEGNHARQTSGLSIPLLLVLSALFALMFIVPVQLLENKYLARGVSLLFYAYFFLAGVALFSFGKGKLLPQEKRLRECCFVLVSLFVAVSGFCINPIQKGADVLLKDSLLAQVCVIVQQDPDSVWITDDAILSQACITARAKVINTVSVYPRFDIWQRIDQNAMSERVYNRYAHINATPATDTWFELNALDSFTVHVDGTGLKKLEVSYWVSRLDLEKESSAIVSYQRIGEANGIGIYRVTFP